MSNNEWKTIPRSFDLDAAVDIDDQVSLILAKTIPECTARRYDFPAGIDIYWDIQLCLADHGPILPVLYIRNDKDYSLIWLGMGYISMLREANNYGPHFLIQEIPGCARLDAGPAVIASTLLAEIDKVDLSGMIAASAIEQILTKYRTRDPWQCFYLAQCAVYLTRYDEAHALLQDSIRYAEEDGRPGYQDVITKAETCLDRLNADPEALRAELNAMVDYNWSHLKVVGAA